MNNPRRVLWHLVALSPAPVTSLIAPKRLLRVPVGTLVAHPENARLGDVEALEASLDAHGLYRPIVVQASTMRVLAGWHTLVAARARGALEVDVTLEDVDDEAARVIVLADNRTNDLATYDEAGLLFALAEADEADQLGAAGFTMDDLRALTRSVDGQAWREREQARRSGDAAGGASEPPIEQDTPPCPAPAQLGQSYTISAGGEHADGSEAVLVVGLAAFQQLVIQMRGRAALVVLRAETVLEAYEDATAFGLFVAAGFVADLLAPGRAFYVEVPPGGRASEDVLAALDASTHGLSHRQTLLVLAQGSTRLPGPAEVQVEHMLVHYGWKLGAAHTWYGGRDQTSVFESFEATPEAACRDAALWEMRLQCATEAGELVVELGAQSASLALEALRAPRTRRALLVATTAANADAVLADAQRLGMSISALCAEPVSA